MPFDAHAEDYQRLKLRLAQNLVTEDPLEVQTAYDNFDKQFLKSRDALPQTDQDRSFSLIARAATLIDRQLPFSEETRAQQIIERAHGLLAEALSLDPDNADAHRMIAASEQPGFDAFFQWLDARADRVKEQCEKRCIETGEGLPKPLRELADHLAMRPYFRWLATMASQALICGRNRESLQLCYKAMEADPLDMGDVRFTAVLALAKLEDAKGLERIKKRFIYTPRRRLASLVLPLQRRSSYNAWLSLANLAIAYKQRDFTSAEEKLQRMLRRYPHAAATFIRQHELPEGVFARLPVIPKSEDELIVALSEATILLQEGREQGVCGPFGTWLAETSKELAKPREAEEIALAQQQAEERFRFISEMARKQAGFERPDDGWDNTGEHDLDKNGADENEENDGSANSDGRSSTLGSNASAQTSHDISSQNPDDVSSHNPDTSNPPTPEGDAS